ncbi:hypothetical protein ACIBO5_43485 [Nonomuraea angiospora]|uniref:hypothetical protein n=1 Tax=Nonomuraea angiospora TaxID=46172 RepID=UPI0037AB87ED
MSARDTGVAPARVAYTAGRMATAWPQVHRRIAREQAARTRVWGTAARDRAVCSADGGAAAVRVLAVCSVDGGVAA